MFLAISLTGWVALSIALSMLFLSTLMFIVGNERSHYIWGMFCLAIATWAWGFYMVTLAQSPDNAAYWWRVSYLGLILNPFLYTHFTLEFTQSKFYLRYKIFLLSALYTVAALFLVFDLYTHFIINNVTLLFGSIYYNTPPGGLYLYFMTIFPCLITLSLLLIFHEYRTRARDPIFRQRAVYFFVASFIAYVGGSMNFLPVYGIAIPPVTNFSVAFGALFIAYAILKYRLFNVKVLTAQFLTLLLNVFTIIRLIISKSIEEIIFNVVILVFTFVIGLYLIRSVKLEVEQREFIEKQEKDLEIVNVAQESLLHFISHEIKGYLAKSQAAFSAIIEGDYGDITPELTQMANLALADVRKGVNTVMDILDASNLKKGAVAFAKDKFDLGASIERVIADLRPSAEQKNLKLVYIAPQNAIRIDGDEEKLAQHVIRNIIDNSVKYTPEGSVTVSLTQEKQGARVVVQDTGVGVTPEDMAHLFTEGGRGKDSIKINVHSTGYGLYIAKQIVEAHKGKIWAESEGAGKGSKFIVELPAA